MRRIIPVAPFDLAIFGGTGDLAQRKLLPALYHRWSEGQILGESRVIAIARGEMDHSAYRVMAEAALREHAGPIDEDALSRFLERLFFVSVDAASERGWDALADLLAAEDDSERVRAFYLAVGPSLFGEICRRIGAAGLVHDRTRVVVEKPLGHDLDSAQMLNDGIRAVFNERQIYRIDHYLGKETVQNLMALRFANTLFEPIWNAQHIDHVQITVAENIGVNGRGAYYDRSGAMRDMVQNHLLQLLCLAAMEPPSRFEADAVRDEKLKVLRALAPIDASNVDQRTVRGRYLAGESGKSYVEDSGNPASRTESYVALKAEIETWRWAGTPFYLRTGKRLRKRGSEIVVQFREPPHSIFKGLATPPNPNALILRLQPDEAVTLEITVKDPGPGGMRFARAPLDMSFASLESRAAMPNAYERLLMDVIRGNQTLFMRGDEVEAAWRWVDPIIEAWSEAGGAPEEYEPGGRGPDSADRLLARDQRTWRKLT